MNGGWNRLAIRVAPNHIHALQRLAEGQKRLLADVAARVLAFGIFRDIRAVIQDPTDETLFTAIALGGSGWPLLLDDGRVRIASITPVDPPDIVDRAPAKELDPGLGRSEIETIRHALVHETNPRHLGGLASTLEPTYPIAASLLRAKAMLLEQRVVRNRMRLLERDQKALSELEAFANAKKPGEGVLARSSVLHKPGEPTVGQILSSMTAHAPWPDVHSMWSSAAENSAKTWTRSDRLSAAVESLTGVSKPKRSLQELRSALVAYAARTGIPIDLLQEEVKRVACTIIEDTQRVLHDGAMGESMAMKRVRSLPWEVQELGQRLVREIGLGVWAICPASLAIACPPTGREGYVSPSALQLSLASWKPAMSGIREPARVPERFKEIGANTIDGLRAQHQMEKADRALERRRWVDWYKRSANAARLV